MPVTWKAQICILSLQLCLQKTLHNTSTTYLRYLMSVWRDWSTVFFATCSQATWGNGQGPRPSSILQAPEERHKQVHNPIACLWLAFDEAKQNTGCDEEREVLKALLCGLPLQCRNNHETDARNPFGPLTGRTSSMIKTSLLLPPLGMSTGVAICIAIGVGELDDRPEALIRKIMVS